jgi:hypothetical protein
MKILKIIKPILIILSLSACKKEKTPDPEPPACIERCNYFSDFTGHRWKLFRFYEDSTTYALNNTGLMPLPTSHSLSINICDNDNIWIVNGDGSSYVLNPVKCLSTDPDTVFQPAWSFSADKKQLIFANASTLNILSLTTLEMKLYEYVTINQGTGPKLFVRLGIYKSI